MTRYIDVDEAVKAIMTSPKVPVYGHEGRYMLSSIISVLMQQPAADVVPKADLDGWLTIVEGFQQMFEYSYEQHQEELAKMKAEVAKEIFAEIEVKIPFLCENQKAYEAFMMKLAELKKKYGVE